MLGQCLCGTVTHWNDVLDQFAEKLRPGSLLISRFRRPAGANDFIQFQPLLHQADPIHAEKSG